MQFQKTGNCQCFATPAEATRCSEVLWWSRVGLLSCSFTFAMLSELILGAFWDSFELFGSLWDLPWESLGPLSGILGSLLGLLGLVGPLLGCSFGLSSALLDSLGLLLGVSFRPSWPKRRPGSDKVPQDSPKSRPRDTQGSQNGTQNVQVSCLFGGPFLNSFRNSFSEGFLDAWPLKICDFAWEVLQKRCFH